MANGYLIRQTAGAVVGLNVLRPPKEMVFSPFAMFGGWLGAELAPHLLAGVAADTAQHCARKGLRGTAASDIAGLVLAGVTAAELASSVALSARAGDAVDAAFAADLDQEEYGLLGQTPQPDRSIPVRALVNPFRMHRPGVVRRRNLSYGDGSKRTRIDIYRRDGSPDGAPVLLQVHGGGWVIGNKDQQGIPLMQEMASRGWVCAAINYPLSPRATWPEHLIAVKRAVAWIRDNADGFGADPSFLAVTGGSAGGHLTAMTALTGGLRGVDAGLQPGFEDADTAVQAAVPMYGVYDFAADSGLRQTRQRVESSLSRVVLGRTARFPEDYRAASPMAWLHPDAPPFLVVHGSNDVFIPVDEARLFAGRLRELSRNPVVFAEIPGAQHAFDIFPSVRSVAVVRRVARFLEYVLLRTGRALPAR